MQHGQDHLGRRSAVRHLVDRDAAPVIDDRDRVVDVDRDVDLVAESRQRLVYGVVDDLVDQVMQPRGSGRADVHGRPLADGLQAFQHLDLVCAVVGDAKVANDLDGVLLCLLTHTLIGIITYV